MDNNIIKEAAKNYLEKGWGVIPVNFSKATIEDGEVKKQFKFLPEYQKYHSEKVLPGQVETLWKGYNGIAITTGLVSKISVVDVDWKDLHEIKDLPETFTVETHKGYHFYFNYTEALKTMSEVFKNGDKEFNVDQRNNGGIVFADPTEYELPDGKIAKYKIIKDVPLADFPVEWLRGIYKKYKPEMISNKGEIVKKDWKEKLVSPILQGSRNNDFVSIIGGLIKKFPQKEWESVVWPIVQDKNKLQDKPLSTAELRAKFDGITKKELEGEEQKDKPTQANALLEAILGRNDVTLFHDEQGDGYICLEIGGYKQIRSCRSKAIRRWLSSEVYRTQGKAPSSETIRSILAVLEGKACFEGKQVKLKDRVAWYGDDLFYDLTNEKWQAVKINKNGWEVVDKPPIIFSRYSHHQAQVLPTPNGNAKLFLDYINITNPEHRLLLIVFLVSCFIPDFPHVMLVIFGAQGSSKSTQSKLSRLVVDPSLIEVSSFPHSQKELVQALAHHYFLFFDNVSYISEEQSDTLCKAITGGGHTKRALYSDDEDIIYSFMRCIGINGINLVTTRPDLLERSLLLELERIEPEKRKTEKELYESFRKDLPSIIGGIFDVLVKAIEVRPTIKLISPPRMSDWTHWGCAIAQALGYTKEAFLAAYDTNIVRQTEMLLNENIVATALFSFMEGKNDWHSTPTELLDRLSQASFGIDMREKYWPKGAQALSRRLNELSTPLRKIGLTVVISTNGAERYVDIQRIAKDTTSPTDLLNRGVKPVSTDGTDGIFEESPKPETPY